MILLDGLLQPGSRITDIKAPSYPCWLRGIFVNGPKLQENIPYPDLRRMYVSLMRIGHCSTPGFILALPQGKCCLKTPLILFTTQSL